MSSCNFLDLRKLQMQTIWYPFLDKKVSPFCSFDVRFEWSYPENLNSKIIKRTRKLSSSILAKRARGYRSSFGVCAQNHIFPDCPLNLSFTEISQESNAIKKKKKKRIVFGDREVIRVESSKGQLHKNATKSGFIAAKGKQRNRFSSITGTSYARVGKRERPTIVKRVVEFTAAATPL